MNLNQVNIAGNLTRDPELRFTPKGIAVCEASVAVNRRWRTESGEEKEEVTFVGLVIWNKSAEAFAKHLRKGRPVFCTGRLSQETWEDKETGKKRERTKVTVESWQFIGPPPDARQTPDRIDPPRASAPTPTVTETEDDPPF